MTKKNFCEAINEAIIEEMRRDDSVFVYGLDVADHKRIFGSTKKLVEEFGEERCFSTPLSEDCLMGFGVGAALNGYRPINIHIRTDFLLLAMNQLINIASNYCYLSAGKLKVPIVIRSIIGRGWGQGAQHSKSLHSIFSHIPGLKVVMPTTPYDAKGLLASAVRDDNPVIFLEHRWLYNISEEVPDNCYTIPLEEPRILKEGKDLTIVSTSWMNIEALKAAEIMKKTGINIEVIDTRSIHPLDYEKIYSSVEKTGYCIISDYDWLTCGFSAEVAANIYENCFSKLKAPIKRIGFAETPCPTTRPLENIFYPNAIKIINSIEELLKLPKTDLSNEEFYSYENQFKGPF